MAPKHEPMPSAAAPKPRGILKNAPQGEAARAPRAPAAPAARVSEGMDPNHLHWDESNLHLHEIERQNQEARMKIDEPKTPFVHSASVPPLDEEGFDLDNGQAPPAPASDELQERLGAVAEAQQPSELVSNTRVNAGSHLEGAELQAAEREREALTAQSAEPGDDSAHWEDEETKAKHAAFSAKRHRHYGNEAQALKLGAALAQDEEQE